MAKWEKTAVNVGVLEIEVDESRVAEALERAFKKVVRDVNVPGFRKGKVPRKIFERRFGVESLYQEALDLLLPEAYSEAVLEQEIDPVDRPQIDITQMEAGKPLLFKATVTVRPEVTLGEYKGISYEDKSTEVTDEEIAEELATIQKSHAELRNIEDGQIEDGDSVTIDFRGTVEGELFEGGEAENYQLEIGSKTFVPGFEEQLIGLALGQERDIEITFPEDYHVKSLAGQKAIFHVKLHEIKRRVLPELDDEFAKDVSEFETFEEYKKSVVENLEHQRAHEREHEIENEIIEKVVAGATLEVPDVMVEQEIDAQLNEFGQRLAQQGIPLDAYKEFTGATTEELRQQFREDAIRRVKTSLVIEAVAKAEALEVSDEAVDLELQKLADSSGLPFDRVKEIFLTRDPGFISLRADLQMKAAIRLLVEHGVKA
ncbi:trigger factor [Ferroacidibacillus organovorans]|uniref:Trigger factor n=1 Tax=Ferroacidibacillus organovorans TaxID=1765683 RepID=A0A162T1N3_9BACL|nr:trigger factor [Ferroacidibacillus organovorans]KYP80369.1 trigger factor [Ferroacidibacillus organovorans]OAG93327.1 trigger factor [Ferroacidibacillus organovorans]OPG16381.1 trigger factor [Ferroacidibacillus organovorans]